MGQQIHRLLREVTGNQDPYHLVKSQSNVLALELGLLKDPEKVARAIVFGPARTVNVGIANGRAIGDRLAQVGQGAA